MLAVGVDVDAIGLVVVVGRTVFRPLFRMVAANDSPELFTAATLLVAVEELGQLGLGRELELGNPGEHEREEHGEPGGAEHADAVDP